MFRLPPPPRFTLPPPPMLSSNVFDPALLVRLSCSSIRQRQQQHPLIMDSRLILFSCMIIFLLSTLLFIIIRFCRKRKFLSHNCKSQLPLPKVKSINSPMNSSCSYETISSKYIDIYVQPIDTSATTYSTDPSYTICLHQQEHDDSNRFSPPPYYHALTILSS